MYFEVAKLSLCSTSGLQALIFWRLIQQGRNLTFINLLMAIQFFVNTINSSILSHFLFKIGSVNFDPEAGEEGTSDLCTFYITSWLVTYNAWNS
jgi:hypothetical protein